jgi:hypothetical protein
MDMHAIICVLPHFSSLRIWRFEDQVHIVLRIRSTVKRGTPLLYSIKLASETANLWNRTVPLALVM